MAAVLEVVAKPDAGIVSRQWASRPDDERYTSLTSMLDSCVELDAISRSSVSYCKSIQVLPDSSDSQYRGLMLESPDLKGVATPTHWAFNQLSSLVGAPPGYLRTLPAPLVADALNWGMHVERQQDVGLYYARRPGEEVGELRAATGPQYGRVLNSSVLRALIERVGDGVTGTWRVPGEFGQRVEVTKQNTTLYMSDRDMFIFLADEDRKIAVPNSRDGGVEYLSRGFLFANSEVGKSSLMVMTMLFRHLCKNRIIWGGRDWKQITVRHTKGAPDRWLREVQPALLAYAESSSDTVVDAVYEAQKAKIDDTEKFLATRFGPRMVKPLDMVHQAEEGRPIETVWDATQAVTAYARRMPWQDERLALEKQAGEMMRAFAPK